MFWTCNRDGGRCFICYIGIYNKHIRTKKRKRTSREFNEQRTHLPSSSELDSDSSTSPPAKLIAWSRELPESLAGFRGLPESLSNGASSASSVSSAPKMSLPKVLSSSFTLLMLLLSLRAFSRSFFFLGTLGLLLEEGGV